MQSVFQRESCNKCYVMYWQKPRKVRFKNKINKESKQTNKDTHKQKTQRQTKYKFYLHSPTNLSEWFLTEILPHFISEISLASMNHIRYCHENKEKNLISDVDWGFVKLAAMTNVFFNNQQHEIEVNRLTCVK